MLHSDPDFSRLAVFAEFERDILKDRAKAGVSQARKRGGRYGRPPSAALQAEEIRELFSQGKSISEIARLLDIGRTSVRRLLRSKSIAISGLQDLKDL